VAASGRASYLAPQKVSFTPGHDPALRERGCTALKGLQRCI